MTTLPKLTAVTLAAFMSTGPQACDTQKEMLKTVEEALAAITHVHAARPALLENGVETAKARVAEADTAFLDSDKKCNDLTIGDTEMPSDARRYLPFNMSMALNEGFTVTDESKEALQKKPTG